MPVVCSNFFWTYLLKIAKHTVIHGRKSREGTGGRVPEILSVDADAKMSPQIFKKIPLRIHQNAFSSEKKSFFSEKGYAPLLEPSRWTAYLAPNQASWICPFVLPRIPARSTSVLIGIHTSLGFNLFCINC